MPENRREYTESILFLEGACLECAMNRRAHELTLRMLLSDSDALINRASRELEMLDRFREQTDFERLFARRAELTGSRSLKVVIREYGHCEFEIVSGDREEENPRPERV